MRSTSRPDMKLYVFETGRINVPDRGMLAIGRGGKPVTIFAAVCLIRHPSGDVIIDTGMNGETWPTEQRKEIVMSPEQRVDRQLERLGLSPGSIRYVIMTHLHMDHSGWMRLFAKSTFIVRKAELRHAWWPEKWLGHLAFDDYKDTRDFTFIEPGDDEDYDVFGDGTVVCIDTKGHSPGHQSVLITLPNSGPILYAGDAVSLDEHLHESVMPAIAWRPDLAYRTICRVQHMERNGVRIFLGHDMEFYKTVRLAPEYYD